MPTGIPFDVTRARYRLDNVDTDQQLTSPSADAVPSPDAIPSAEPEADRSVAARAVLFDLDGTLIDSTPVVVACWTRWAVEFGVRREDFDRVHTHGRTAAGIIGDLLPTEQVPAALERIIELESSEVDGLRALPGAPEFFAAVPPDRRAVVTSGTRDVASVRLAAVDLQPRVLVTADDVRRGKPDPEPFLLGAERLGVAPRDCLVVEDAPVGLSAARAAGMRTIAVTTTHEADQLDADLVVDRLDRLRVLADTDADVDELRIRQR